MSYDVKNFQTEVLSVSNTRPVLCDFWASWCKPCKFLTPILEKLVIEAKDQWILRKVNIEEHTSIASQFNIMSIPNVKLFINENVKSEFSGLLPEKDINQWLKKNLPNQFENQLQKAAKFETKGYIEKSKEVLETIINSDEDNEDAILQLTKLVMFSDPIYAKTLCKKINLGSDIFEEIQTIKYICELNLSLDQLPNHPTKNLFVSSIENLKKRNFEDALKILLDIVKIDKRYNDDMPRKTCLAIFKYLADSNDITKRYRSLLNAALY